MKHKSILITAIFVAVIAAIPLELQRRAKASLHDELDAAQKQIATLKTWQHKAEAQLAVAAKSSPPLVVVENQTAPVTEPSDPVATFGANLQAAFAKDPQATMVVLKDFVTSNRPLQPDQRVDPNSDPAAATSAAMNMPPGQDRNRAIVEAAQAWVQKDPGAASEWMASVVSTLPQEDKTQEHVIEALLPAAMQEDPQTALVWASAIGDDQVRSNRLNDVVSAWAKTNPAAATQAVQTANLPDDTRAGLLQMIQMMANPSSPSRN